MGSALDRIPHDPCGHHDPDSIWNPVQKERIESWIVSNPVKAMTPFDKKEEEGFDRGGCGNTDRQQQGHCFSISYVEQDGQQSDAGFNDIGETQRDYRPVF